MNRNITRIVAIAATLAMGTSLAACGGSSADSSKGHVYFMNNKAEVVDQYKELASMYTKKTRAGGHPDRSRRHIRCHHEV